jgi:hypothetical protein
MNLVFEYDVQTEFEKSREALKFSTNLNLSLSEQIILKQIVKNAIRDSPKDIFSSSNFEVSSESAVRFIMQEYGVNYDPSLTVN